MILWDKKMTVIKSRYVSYIFLSLLCLGYPAKGTASENEPVRRVLANGMTVIVQENHAAPVVSIQVWINTGSVYEGETEFGMAHMLEHMFFKGTETRGVGTIAKEVEGAGGQINAYTSWEMTVYYVNMTKRFMNKGIDILADLIQSATFVPQEMEKEKKVILEEIRRSKDKPSRILSEAFFNSAYRIHPYKRPVIGFDTSVENFTREDLLSFYRKWYVPENMVWVMVGDLNPEELLPELENALPESRTRRYRPSRK